MKKILILTSVLLLTLFICKVPSKAASNLNITGFTKLEEGETYGEGYYIIHALVQDDNVYDQDYEQFANYFTRNSNIEYCNLTPFYKSNVHDLLKSTFNMCTDETNANFLTEVREYSTRRFGACCMFYTLESFNYAYLEETCGEIGDLYRVNIEEGPNIAGSNTHIINYDNNTYETSKIEQFFIPAGTAVELYATTLHFAPSRQNNEEFRCGIVLIKDTNLPLETIPTDLTGENRLLFARNKWLICHSESKPATRGGCIGLIGKNLEI